MRRNLEHLRDLDDASCQLMEDWRDKQDACLHGVEESLVKAFSVVEASGKTFASSAKSFANTDDNGESVTPPGARTVGGEFVAKDEKRGGTKRKQSQEQQRSTTEKKAACTQCRARKVKCDGRHAHCLNRRILLSPIEGGKMSDEDKNSVMTTTTTTTKQSPSHDTDPVTNTSLSSSQSTLTPTLMTNRDPPTSDEIESALATHQPNCILQRQEIMSMYHDLQQLSNEKIKTAHQLKAMIDMTLGRLNRDFKKFEKELGIDPASIPNNSENVVGVNLLGGIPGVGFGTVNHHAPTEGGQMMMMTTMVGTHGANGVNHPSLSPAATSFATALPPSAPLPINSASLPDHSTTTVGEVPPPPKSIQTTNLAAIKVTPDSPDWILAKIISHDKSTRMYTLSDEDIHSNQVYKISERQVVPLKGTERNKWARGDVVYAIYPDTTSFYHATVSTPPFNGYVMVQFKDDWDANGVTHEKAVLVAHVMKVPPGGT